MKLILALVAWLAFCGAAFSQDDQAAERSAWDSAVLHRIQNHVSGLKRGEEGVVRIKFAVDSRGAIRSASVVKSSGRADLDKLALRAVRQSSPLPPPPKFLPSPEMSMAINFVSTGGIPRTRPATPAQAQAMRDWTEAVLNHLSNFPIELPSGNRQQALVAFTVDRTGRVLSTKLLRSSGMPEQDAAAIRVFQRANPLPPPPKEIQGATVTSGIAIGTTPRTFVQTCLIPGTCNRP
jgi:protein TonB